jgi:predicted PurR-regulated permease PerM
LDYREGIVESSQAQTSNEDSLARAVETTVRIAIVLLLVALCLQILAPFAAPVAWGIIIAVALTPVHDRIVTTTGRSTRLSAIVLTLVLLLLLIVPAVIFAGSIIESASGLAEQLGGEEFALPPPPEGVQSWPLIGEKVYQVWSQATTNLGAALSQFESEIRAVGGWLLSTSAGTGIAFLQFLISIIIAGVLLASGHAAQRAAVAISIRLAGVHGRDYVDMAAATVRSVCVGILGVALIQAALISVGFLAVGLPHAGLWAALCLFLAILQLPPALVVLPTIFYIASTESTLIVVVYSAWELVASMSDSVLKPILLARGVAVPMLVIFLGSIGGFMSFGFIGLFIGAVVLSLGYELFMAWLGETAAPEDETEPDAA